MKYLYTLLLVVFVSAQHVQAQSPLTAFGGKGGVTFGHFTGEDAELPVADKEMRLGFTAGAFATIGVHPIISIQPEVIYTQKGQTYTAGTDALSGTWNVQADYLEIPVLAKVYWPTMTDTRPFVYAGPFIGFNMAANADNVYEVGSFDFATDADLDESINPVESGIAFGVGITQQMRKSTISLDVRYTLGLTKAYDDTVFDEVFTGTLATAIEVGYRL